MTPQVIFDLPADHCKKWLSEGRAIWLKNPMLFLALSLIVILVRRNLDSLTYDYLILLSYFSDALLFAWLFLGLKNRTDSRVWSLITAGGRSLKGRIFRVIFTGVWGIPAAITSYFIFLFAPEIIRMVVVLNGDALVATCLLFLGLCLGLSWCTSRFAPCYFAFHCFIVILPCFELHRDICYWTHSIGGLE